MLQSLRSGIEPALDIPVREIFCSIPEIRRKGMSYYLTDDITSYPLPYSSYLSRHLPNKPDHEQCAPYMRVKASFRYKAVSRTRKKQIIYLVDRCSPPRRILFGIPFSTRYGKLRNRVWCAWQRRTNYICPSQKTAAKLAGQIVGATGLGTVVW